MRKTIRLLHTTAIAGLVSLSVAWIDAANAGTNFTPLADYPLPACAKPSVAPQPPPAQTERVVMANGMTVKTVSGGQSVLDYNKRIAQSNAEQSNYTDCMNAYVVNAQADIDMIREILNRTLAAQTNFPALKRYPSPSCEKPNKVVGPTDKQDVTGYNKNVRQYNDQIAQFNIELHQYTDCMNAYVANAQADMDLIKAKVNQSQNARN